MLSPSLSGSSIRGDVPQHAEAADAREESVATGEEIGSGYLKVLSVLYYMGASILVQSSNKALFTIWGFQFPLLIAFLQLSFTSLVMYFVAKPKMSLETARIVLPLALTNVCNITAGLMGTAGMNVPMFIALRRCSLITTLLCEYFLYKQTREWGTLGQIGLMVGGALIAAANDLTFNAYGYTAALVNNLFTSAYLVLVKNIKHGLTTNGLLFYTSVLSLPVLLAVLLSTSQGSAWSNYPELYNPSFLITFAGSTCLGLAISHSIFLCTKYTEPLTVQVAGSWKNIFMTFLGAVAFGDFVFAFWNVTGLAISMIGSCIYGYYQVANHGKGHRAAAGPNKGAIPRAPSDAEGGAGGAAEVTHGGSDRGGLGSRRVSVSRDDSPADTGGAPKEDDAETQRQKKEQKE